MVIGEQFTKQNILQRFTVDCDSSQIGDTVGISSSMMMIWSNDFPPGVSNLRRQPWQGHWWTFQGSALTSTQEEEVFFFFLQAKLSSSWQGIIWRGLLLWSTLTLHGQAGSWFLSWPSSLPVHLLQPRSSGRFAAPQRSRCRGPWFIFLRWSKKVRIVQLVLLEQPEIW